MEQIYSAAELASDTVMANRSFLRRLLHRLRGHRIYDHPINLALAAGDYDPDAARLVFAQMLEIIEAFTGVLSLLAGRAPDLRSRHLVLQELSDQMGRGRIEEAHAMLWRRLLRSIGAAPAAEAGYPAMGSIARLNARMQEAVQGRAFPIACSWVAFGEAPVANVLGHLARAAETSFARPGVDRTYFDRRAERDHQRGEDAHLLIALHASSEDHLAIGRAAREALDLQAAVFDDLQISLSLRDALRALGGPEGASRTR